MHFVSSRSAEFNVPRRALLAVAAFWFLTCSTLVLASGPEDAPEPNPWVQPGDRVVFVGSGWVERMQQHPWLEMMLTAQVPEATFRNIGWSGDTVHGDARAVFGGRADGYQRLMKDLDYASPKVAFLCYGENEAFGNESQRAEFLAGYHKLIDEVKRHPCRIVLVVPRQREQVGPNYPDPNRYNQNLAKLAEGIRGLATEHACGIIDLESFAIDQRFTTDGVAWNDAGYEASGREFMRQLGFKDLRLDAIAEQSPNAIDALRTLVQRKNEWFFHRYRPQNETYLFLFRKHEQGNNAPEVELMERYVQDGEAEIAEWIRQSSTSPRN